MNAIFATNKSRGISSNGFLTQLKRKMGWKKCGYCGTLDPFASGLLIVGVGAYTRLFNYLDKKQKTYEATLWLGCRSETLDIEGVEEVSEVAEFAKERIQEVLESFVGEVEYIPPKYSAKHINGKRAYALAREGIDFELMPSKMQVYQLELLHYLHPFLHFRVCVSEGAYIRSLGELIAKKLGCNGSLSQLRRTQEGNIIAPKEGIYPLDLQEILALEKIELNGLYQEIKEGKKIKVNLEGLKKHQPYLAIFEDFFSIIEFEEKGEIKYLLNRIPKC